MSVAGGVPKHPNKMVAGALCRCANEIVTDIHAPIIASVTTESRGTHHSRDMGVLNFPL